MVESMQIFSAEEAAAWTGGSLVGTSAVSVYSAAVDSRKCSPGCLFFSLRGERVDGHDYLGQVFNSGACGAVVAEDWYGAADNKAAAADLLQDGRFIIVVADPLKALQVIAANYMKRITGPKRIGVTGSNGKTTTKELISSVLEQKYSVVKTEGNYNSEIGLPLTVFNIKNHHEYAVIEMGINRLGEMDVLTEILRPDMVVITNIGTAHIGIFSNIETIAYEKRRAAAAFDSSGVLFVDEDESFIDFLSEGHSGTTKKFGEESLKSLCGAVEYESVGLKGWNLTIDGQQLTLPLVGIHNLKNAFCAAVVGMHEGLTLEKIKAGLEKATPLFGRGEIIDGPVTVISDCYNANADSLARSIEFVNDLKWTGARFFVLGDMKELGEHSAEVHRSAGRAAAASSADEIFFFGEDSLEAYHAAMDTIRVQGGSGPEIYHIIDYKLLEHKLIGGIKEGDLVLIKGSRSMNLERLLEPIAEKFRGAEC